jgi:drug/metabolite transporter (DMT)-like permease
VAAQVIMTEALQHVGGASAGVISQLTAVLAIAAGATVLGEPLTARFGLGATLALGGVVLAIVGASRDIVVRW